MGGGCCRHITLVNWAALLETTRKLGRINFRSAFWDCYKVQGKELANSWAARPQSPVTIPETIAGCISFPVHFSFLKWRPYREYGSLDCLDYSFLRNTQMLRVGLSKAVQFTPLKKLALCSVQCDSGVSVLFSFKPGHHWWYFNWSRASYTVYPMGSCLP